VTGPQDLPEPSSLVDPTNPTPAEWEAMSPAQQELLTSNLLGDLEVPAATALAGLEEVADVLRRHGYRVTSPGRRPPPVEREYLNVLGVPIKKTPREPPPLPEERAEDAFDSSQYAWKPGQAYEE
jgi:hypothetical protein